MAGMAKFLNVTTLVGHNGEVPLTALAGKTVMFYFSASWCPPCRGFTPLLKEFYEKFHTQKNFEVVFCSWDEEPDDHNAYFAGMPWLSVPFEARKDVESLGKMFSVESIPTLIAVNADSGEVLTVAARHKVVNDPDGISFPWKE